MDYNMATTPTLQQILADPDVQADIQSGVISVDEIKSRYETKYGPPQAVPTGIGSWKSPRPDNAQTRREDVAAEARNKAVIPEPIGTLS